MIQSASLPQLTLAHSGFASSQATTATAAPASNVSVTEIADPAPAPAQGEKATSENYTPGGQLSAANITALQGEEVDETGDKQQKDQVSRAEEKQLEAKEEAEQEQIDTLKARDREVRAHEQAHAAVGGPYASAPTYEYQTGPDGERYAVGGEVKIDTAPVPDDPAATVAKMEVVIRAALAPAEPSAQDKAVAAAAAKQRNEAQADLIAERQAERAGETEDTDQEAANGNTPPASAEPIINLIA
ncbi:putative metalloprotease CJM1_0395 family protein [Sneathiella glossodoripedis]|uniref:putative metalloprotease CJM1_0395 family protein n=1 Tax=Sneathiella glossodoripedis TaxID=418853 RepID=UPI00046F8045|nr:putative metalloprotease CJM1_0395 family protein [Sneathiella glossodoripedis]